MTPADLLARAVAADPARPRLTWYGDHGDRVELSGATLANWTAKTAHLLAGELAAGPGTRVAVRLPGHWLVAPWLLAVWTVGAVLALDDAAADVVVADRAGAAAAAEAGADEVVAVPVAALPGPLSGLPPLVHDYAVEVRGQPDRWTGPAVPDRAPALDLHGATLTGADLAGAAVEAATAWALGADDRLLCLTADLAVADLVLPGLLAPLAAGASAVWSGNRQAAQDVWRTERVTAAVGLPPESGSSIRRLAARPLSS